ncbi:MAG: glutathione peroxidase [Actinomycetota bacterium]
MTATMSYDHPLKTLEGDPVEMTDYKGKLLLIVNVASRCGFTPQYEGLQKLYDIYKDRGFEILGFPCNQFLAQEPGTEEEIREFCSSVYGVSFPIFRKIDVNGEERHPLYAELEAFPDHKGIDGDVQWNFEKFLVAPGGEVVGRFRTKMVPEHDVLIGAIEKHLPE